jgi:hypothetical protein
VILWIHPAAEREVREAVRHYNSEKPDLGNAFYREFLKSQQSIEYNYDQHALLESNASNRPVRRALLSRFPYYVVFEVLSRESTFLRLLTEVGVRIIGLAERHVNDLSQARPALRGFSNVAQ